MLRFSDTAQRELRSATSLLRGNRDKPAENSYLEQCQQAKLPLSSWAAAALWEQEYLLSAACLVQTHSRALLRVTLCSRGISLPCSGCGHGTAGTHLLSHRCSFLPEVPGGSTWSPALLTLQGEAAAAPTWG